jgi:uncharacterized protein (TIGR00251 family)
MILNVRVAPKASRNLVKQEDNRLKVYLTKPNQDGLANKQLIELLSEHLEVEKYRIKIIRGQKSRDKVIQVE